MKAPQEKKLTGSLQISPEPPEQNPGRNSPEKPCVMQRKMDVDKNTHRGGRQAWGVAIVESALRLATLYLT